MRRLLSIIIASLMMVLLLSGTAFADVKVDKVYMQIDRLDAQIQKQIDNAVQDGKELMDNYYAELAKYPERTQELTDELNINLDNIITNLINNTNARVDSQIPVFEKKGVAVESYYITVVIGNREVLVDPCRTIGN